MASRAELTAWTDEATGQRFVQIEGTIYEQIGSTRSDRRLPGSGAIGWGDVPEDPRLAEHGWQEAGSGRGKNGKEKFICQNFRPLLFSWNQWKLMIASVLQK